MKTNHYVLSGISAIIVAISYPLLWLLDRQRTIGCDVSECTSSTSSLHSILLLIAGMLIMYMYYGLIRLLHDYYNYHKADVPLIALISMTSVFYLGTFLVEMLQSWHEYNLTSGVMQIVGAIAFGIIDILLAVALLRGNSELPNLIKNFAIVNLIAGVLEISVLFSFLTVIILPISALILAACFFTKPKLIEFV